MFKNVPAILGILLLTASFLFLGTRYPNTGLFPLTSDGTDVTLESGNLILQATSELRWSTGLNLVRDAAQALSLVDTTNAMTQYIYGTADTNINPTNYERLAIGHDGTDGFITMQEGGTGGDNANILFKPLGTGFVRILIDATSRHLSFTNAANSVEYLKMSASGSSFDFDVDGGDAINFRDGGIVNVKISSDGNLGVGPSTPNGRFSVGDVTEGGTGQFSLQTTQEAHTLAAAKTSTTTGIDIPSGAILVGCSLTVNTAVSDDDGDDTWSAIYEGGATQEIAATSTAPTQNTKIDKFFDANNATAITSAETNITFTANGSNFDAGVIEILCYYYDLTSMANA